MWRARAGDFLASALLFCEFAVGLIILQNLLLLGRKK